MWEPQTPNATLLYNQQIAIIVPFQMLQEGT